MDQPEVFDVIINGITLESSLFGVLLSLSGLNVLQISKKDFYGEHEATLTLNELREAVHSRQLAGNILLDDFQASNILIDLCPKIIYADSKTVELLVSTNVNNYLDFTFTNKTCILQNGRISSLPLTVMELIESPILSLNAKRTVSKLLHTSRTSVELSPEDLCLSLEQFAVNNGLDEESYNFIKNAVVLGSNKTSSLVNFFRSVGKFSDSSFITPFYGYGELTQAFARLIAVLGGTQALAANVADDVLYVRGAPACQVSYSRYIEFEDKIYPYTLLVLDGADSVNFPVKSFLYHVEEDCWMWRSSCKLNANKVYSTLVISKGLYSLESLAPICNLDQVLFHYVQAPGTGSFSESDDIFDSAFKAAESVVSSLGKSLRLDRSLANLNVVADQEQDIDSLTASLDAIL